MDEKKPTSRLATVLQIAGGILCIWGMMSLGYARPRTLAGQRPTFPITRSVVIGSAEVGAGAALFAIGAIKRRRR